MTECLTCLDTGQSYLEWNGERHPWDFCKCIKGSCLRLQTRADIPADALASQHQQVQCLAGSRAAWVDSGIYADILLLWDNDVNTRFSCEGGFWDDFGRTRYVALADKQDLPKAVKLLSWVNWVSPDGLPAVYESGKPGQPGKVPVSEYA